MITFEEKNSIHFAMNVPKPAFVSFVVKVWEQGTRCQCINGGNDYTLGTIVLSSTLHCNWNWHTYEHLDLRNIPQDISSHKGLHIIRWWWWWRRCLKERWWCWWWWWWWWWWRWLKEWCWHMGSDWRGVDNAMFGAAPHHPSHPCIIAVFVGAL